jgi:hypothetical protein
MSYVLEYNMFGRIYRLHLQAGRISQARNQIEAGNIAGLFLGLLFDSEDGCGMLLRNID